MNCLINNNSFGIMKVWLYLCLWQQKGLYPLHIAAGLLGAEGPEITELLLHALADPDLKAQDQHEVFQLDQVWGKNCFYVNIITQKCSA